MVSYVYGVNYDIDQIIQLAKKHNLTLLEDLAETFSGTDYNGKSYRLYHPLISSKAIQKPICHSLVLELSKLTLHSMVIQISFCLSQAFLGALTVVRNNDVLYRKMKYIHDLYPMQLTSTYL